MNRCSMVWLQSGGCGGCTLSLLTAESPDLISWLEGEEIDLAYHPSLSAESDDAARATLQRYTEGSATLDILCLEGAVMTGPNGTGLYHCQSGSRRPMMDVIRELCQQARYVVAIGSCASWGGITSAPGNDTDAVGLQFTGQIEGGLLPGDFLSRAGLPVINIAGCPIHPGWVLDTLAELVAGRLTQNDLDALNRPLLYSGVLAHHACPRNEFYEYKASASAPGQQGCLMEHLGCKATQAHADCNIRLWNGQGSCTRGGYACISCTDPEWEEPGHAFERTPKLAGIPIGLPTDMPKAWFMALSSLSKAATPKRLAHNAQDSRLSIPPAIRLRKRKGRHE
ncbi:MAG: HupU protein [Gammaproteobacteria bacterium]|nr:MAG: HupU protein [Gammaproteobacteria bacterium]